MFLVFWINIVFWYSSKFYYSYSLVLARAWPFYYDAERRGYILFGIDFIFFITARQSAKHLREGKHYSCTTDLPFLLRRGIPTSKGRGGHFSGHSSGHSSTYQFWFWYLKGERKRVERERVRGWELVIVRVFFICLVRTSPFYYGAAFGCVYCKRTSIPRRIYSRWNGRCLFYYGDRPIFLCVIR